MLKMVRWQCPHCGYILSQEEARAHPDLEAYITRPEYPRFMCLSRSDGTSRHFRAIDFTEIFENTLAEIDMLAEIEAQTQPEESNVAEETQGG